MITEPGDYFVKLEDQGGYPFWVWLRVYLYPIDAKNLKSEMELYCSAITAGHQGINHKKLSSIWNIQEVRVAPLLQSIIPKV